MGLFRANETNIQMESNIVKNPNWLKTNQLHGYFTNVVEDLNSGLPGTNPACESGTRGLRITSPAP